MNQETTPEKNNIPSIFIIQTKETIEEWNQGKELNETFRSFEQAMEKLQEIDNQKSDYRILEYTLH